MVGPRGPSSLIPTLFRPTRVPSSLCLTHPQSQMALISTPNSPSRSLLKTLKPNPLNPGRPTLPPLDSVWRERSSNCLLSFPSSVMELSLNSKVSSYTQKFFLVQNVEGSELTEGYTFSYLCRIDSGDERHKGPRGDPLPRTTH